MSRLRRVLLVVFCGVLTGAGLIYVRLAGADLSRRPAAAVAGGQTVPSNGIRLAVLGDSDSQSYHDPRMSRDPNARGGPWRTTTWQWTEVLAQLRGDQIDQGEWGAWGTNKYRAYFDEAFGALARAPAKEDYRYNFAISGAWSNQLMGHPMRQAIRLVALMDTEPQAWKGGVVLIRIGINDVGSHEVLDAMARDPNGPFPTERINAALGEIGKAVALIRKHHPDTYVLLIGILSNADWSGEFDNWQSASAIANIDAGLNRFDDGLRKLAAADRHVAFLGDRAWFANLWGARDERGRPLYKTVRLSPGWAITNTSGDDPHNAATSDGHAGVVWNTLWAQHLVASLNTAFGLHLKPITDAEVIDFLRPSFKASQRSASERSTSAAEN
ncbi:SGNH/GDSL hydrolase family protein [Paraburkholderia caribensis]|uniref:SGNH/GDSL hydrolase family protein n=1 Tax=Paraburkholderia caribensis TaxID=75105 RepID=UPI000566612E|nr:SGNH/GDSL hydrolase family protein [Paraburkholderia caribensis]